MTRRTAVNPPVLLTTRRGRVVRFFEHSALLDIGNGLKGLLAAEQLSWLNKRPNPWVKFLEKFPIGTMTTRRVVSVRKHAVFVMLPNGCTGRLHKREFRPATISLGDAVSVVVLANDHERNSAN